MKTYNKFRIQVKAVLIAILLVGCNRFLEIGAPNSRINSETVFNNDNTAFGALNGVYQNLFLGFGGGGAGSVALYAGLSADEIHYVNSSLTPKPDREEINQNNVSAANGEILSLWSSFYSVIYGANSILERIDDSKNIPRATVDQIRGEALFIRSFSYFYLVNLFGEIPLVTTTDYRLNSSLSLSSEREVYAQITGDLEMALDLLTPSFLGNDKFGANRWAAAAMMARVQLYMEDWPKADEYATQVINKDDLYELERELDRVFTTGSREAIWVQHYVTGGTQEATVFITQNEHFLSDQLLACFLPADNRYPRWVWLKNTEPRLYVPYKYQFVSPTASTEHSVVLRLAEQYLIRSEARAKQGMLAGAIADLDAIRKRAGLPSIEDVHPGIDREALMDSIMVERQRELFTEGGHRWLDLKRTGRISEALSAIKPGFTIADEWYPIPESEVLKNPNLER